MMDLPSLLRGALPANATSSSHGANGSAHHVLRDELLDNLTPLLGFGLQFNPLMRLFMVLNHMFGSRLGIEPTYVLTVAGLLWAANKLWNQLSAALHALARRHFMVSISINEADDIYRHLMKWLAAQPQVVRSRSLVAETDSRGAWEEESDEVELRLTQIAADASNVFLNFSHQEAKKPPRFTPAAGAHSFWFRGGYFTLVREQRSMMDPNATLHGGLLIQDRQDLVISCFGRSPEPIKELLRHAKEQFYQDHQAKTIIRRPAGHNIRRYGPGRHNWHQVADRPVRPLRTVVLDDEQKIRVLTDMNEYLHPATPRWYANRGIPLRRGYLFHGPPGTGKTSLSFALAGVFGLDIYVISLLDPTLTEEDLLGLFNSLPRRCIVLLEDIDSAGLRRPDDPEPAPSDDEKEAAKDKEKQGTNHSDTTKNNKRSGRRSRSRKKSSNGGGGGGSSSGSGSSNSNNGDNSDNQGISLSGLLNAIDGVASHEGRVLIMTTNKPESLDEALIRPGRVDLQVAFTHATQQQAKELFVRMYEPEDGYHAASTKSEPSSSPPLSRVMSELSLSASSLPSPRKLVERVMARTKKKNKAEPMPAALPSPPPSPLSVASSGSSPCSSSFSSSSSATTTAVTNRERDGDLTDVSGPTEAETSDGDEPPFRGAMAAEAEPEDALRRGKRPGRRPAEREEEGEGDAAVAKPTAAAKPQRKPAPLTFPSSAAASLTSEAANACLEPRQGEEEEEDDDNGHDHGHDHDHEPPLVCPAELSQIASSFAALIPTGVFSPAELQGFLLKRKKTPRRAAREAKAWVEGMLAKKAGGSKVLGPEVQ
ncbi:hypothetical protein VTJ83DRAFT_3453 [Remersonia thermophila]|uniref:Mitochondrial chaperone BCS1 n=1 Tax=Remersonia thermophila TaxID=72144 RepID=A0ABR4DG81_9PEZI